MFHSMEELIQQNDSHVELYTGLPEQNFPVQVSSMGSCRVEECVNNPTKKQERKPEMGLVLQDSRQGSNGSVGKRIKEKEYLYTFSLWQPWFVVCFTL